MKYAESTRDATAPTRGRSVAPVADITPHGHRGARPTGAERLATAPCPPQGHFQQATCTAMAEPRPVRSSGAIWPAEGAAMASPSPRLVSRAAMAGAGVR